MSKSAEEWATHCHAHHYLGLGCAAGPMLLCVDCARAYARECAAELEKASRWRGIVAGIHERVVKRFEPWNCEDKRFLALALAGEVGELLNLLKKEWRGDEDFDEGRAIEEMADVRIYLDLLATSFGSNLDQACNFILETKLARRWPDEYAATLRALPGETP